MSKRSNLGTSLTPLNIFAGSPLKMQISTGNTVMSEQILKLNGLFVCGLCQESFINRVSCFNHLNIHMGTTTCSWCSKVLSSKQRLSEHLAKHYSRVQCKKCYRFFVSNFKLNMHKRTTECRRK